MPSEFTASGPMGERLATSIHARRQRAERALSYHGIPSAVIRAVRSTRQASASIVETDYVLVLVSYQTVVAFRYLDGSTVSTPRGYYSRTTDRSIADFARGQIRHLPVDEFGERLKARLS